MMERSHPFDTTVLLLVVVLTCFGVVMVYSSSSIMAARRFADGFFFLKRQALFAGGGLVLMALLMRVDYHHLRRLAVPALIGCIVLLLAVLIPGIGHRAGGAARWISFPGFSLQPAELAKMCLVLYMAHSLTKKQEKIKSFTLGFVPYMVVLALLIALIMLQPDMGSALTLAVVAMSMLLVAGARFAYLLSVGILATPFVCYLIVHESYRMRRILAFLDPWQDPSGAGFQIIQSWIAIGTGGFLGNGLGDGRQKLFYLPEAHTDFIFSVIGEELGFVGVFVVASMFLLLVLRGINIALNAPDDFGRHLAFGLSLLIGLQAFTNMAVALGLLPTKGLTLPFISYGGTSLLCTLAAVAVLLNISWQTKEEGR